PRLPRPQRDERATTRWGPTVCSDMRGKLKHFGYWLAGTCAAGFLLVAGCGADTGGANDDAVSTMPTAGTSLPGTGSGTATPSASTPPTTLTKPTMPPEAGNTTLKGHL